MTDVDVISVVRVVLDGGKVVPFDGKNGVVVGLPEEVTLADVAGVDMPLPDLSPPGKEGE